MEFLTATLLLIASPLAFADLSPGCQVAGPDDAPVTIEEFVDFQCYHCAKGSDTMEDIVKAYAGNVRLVMRNLPLPGHSPESIAAAKAFSAMCMQSHELAHSFERELFTNQTRFLKEGTPYLFEAAAKVGANVPQLKAEMESGKVAQALADDQVRASNREISGTPAYLFNQDAKLIGAWPLAKYKEMIDEILHPRS